MMDNSLPEFSSTIISPKEPNRTWVVVRLVLAIIGIISGVMIFFTFGFHYGNWHAAIFGLVSGVFAVLALVVIVLYRRGFWTDTTRLSWLRVALIIGCIGQLISVCAFCIYIVLAIVFHQSLHMGEMYGSNYWMGSVWSFMTWKWAFMLFWSARQFRNYYLALWVTQFANSTSPSGPGMNPASGMGGCPVSSIVAPPPYTSVTSGPFTGRSEKNGLPV